MVTALFFFFFSILFILPANSIYVSIDYNVLSTPTDSPNFFEINFNTTITRYSKGGEIIFILANIERDPSLLSLSPSSSSFSQQEYDFQEDLHPRLNENWKPTEQVFSERLKVTTTKTTKIHFTIPTPSVHRVWVKVEGGGRGEDSAIILANKNGEIKIVSQNNYYTQLKRITDEKVATNDHQDNQYSAEVGTIEMNVDSMYSHIHSIDYMTTAEPRTGQINIAGLMDSFPLDIDLSDTISTVKSKIYAKKGIKADYQQLLYLGKFLEDNKTLDDYHVKTGEKSKLTTLRLSDGSIMANTNIRFKVGATPADTVEQLTKRVKDVLQIASDDEISLILERQNQIAILENGKTLAYYNLTEDEVPHLFVKPVNALILSIEHLMGNTHVYLPTTATMRDLKEKIEEKTGIAPAQQNIKLNQMPNNRMNNMNEREKEKKDKEENEDGKTLGHLKNLMTAFVVFPGRYKITVFGLEKPVLFNVAESDTIGHLKSRIVSVFPSISLSQLSLFYSFSECLDEFTLSHYSIFDDSVILVVRNGTFVY